MNGRIYDPLIGRFLSADTVVQAPANLQSYNRYSYVMNRPLSLVDPSGYVWWNPFSWDWSGKRAGGSFWSPTYDNTVKLSAQSVSPSSGSTVPPTPPTAGTNTPASGGTTPPPPAPGSTSTPSTAAASTTASTTATSAATSASPSVPPGLTVVVATPQLIAELQKTARGRQILAELQKGDVVVLFGDTSQLKKTGITRTHGRHLSAKALTQLGFTGMRFGMVIDDKKIAADGLSGKYKMTNEEVAVAVMDNEFKAYDLRTNKTYQAASDSDKQKMELSDQQANPTANVSTQLMQDAVKTANDPNSVYNNPAQINVKASDLQLPPGATLVTFP